jgi:hypothetical protein
MSLEIVQHSGNQVIDFQLGDRVITGIIAGIIPLHPPVFLDRCGF